MRTRAKRDDDDWVINGTKMWITNGSVADVAIVWAQTDDGIQGVRGPDRDAEILGPKVTKKLSLRASVTSELVLEDVHLPGDSVLPDAIGLRGPLSCLNEARLASSSASWAQPGLPGDRDRLRDLPRGVRPPALPPVDPGKLADMTLELQKGFLLALHLGRLKDDHRLKPEQVSLGKLNNVRKRWPCPGLPNHPALMASPWSIR